MELKHTEFFARVRAIAICAAVWAIASCLARAADGYM